MCSSHSRCLRARLRYDLEAQCSLRAGAYTRCLIHSFEIVVTSDAFKTHLGSFTCILVSSFIIVLRLYVHFSDTSTPPLCGGSTCRTLGYVCPVCIRNR